MPPSVVERFYVAGLEARPLVAGKTAAKLSLHRLRRKLELPDVRPHPMSRDSATFLVQSPWFAILTEVTVLFCDIDGFEDRLVE